MLCQLHLCPVLQQKFVNNHAIHPFPNNPSPISPTILSQSPVPLPFNPTTAPLASIAEHKSCNSPSLGAQNTRYANARSAGFSVSRFVAFGVAGSVVSISSRLAASATCSDSGKTSRSCSRRMRYRAVERLKARVAAAARRAGLEGSERREEVVSVESRIGMWLRL